MKQRIISALFGLVILFAVFSLFETIVLNAVVAAIIVLALHELFTAAGERHTSISYLAMGFGATIPFFKTWMLERALPAVCFLFAFVLLCALLRHHRDVKAERMGFIFCFTILIAFSTTCFVYLRDFFGLRIGFYAVLVTLVGAWMSDTGAYFFGLAFGRHKLAPEISPKITVEGALGGILAALVSQGLVAFGYSFYCAKVGAAFSINLPLLLACSPLISVVSIIGDLSASVMKRQFGIKDFGHIMPGHGGVLDRFDSVLLVIPFVYNLFLYLPLASTL